MNKFFHPYHLVTESPWPLLGSLSLMIFMMGVVKWFNEFNNNLLFIGSLTLLFILIQWWRDVIRESTLQGNHTLKVLKSIQIGMILFILSEVMFFTSFFWSYFHMFLSPSIELGNNWPPKEILVFNPYNIPLLNTLILLSSGVSITWCHNLIYQGFNWKSCQESINLTILLGGLFIMFQYKEYSESFFSISDSIYGSVFFMMTGFHGLHVIIGVLFIIISMNRLLNFHYSNFHHFGFEAASWYWHFVDLVWLFLYLFIYWLSF
uniref:Cytochrome c oxidase subunit 3 n=1 Tax=Diachasmimorpha longicaudata TaxID=58733 RepID=D8WHB8_9HYME|nr:cytochrome c oxidase subunit III [Diachasmimorpha longicaudata]